MKTITLRLWAHFREMRSSSLVLASLLASASIHAAVPADWEVDLAAQSPKVFTLQRPRGETYELEAVLKRHGKPFEPAITNACIYWQTNGMENLYWSAPASVSNNVLRATWLPSMDPGATTVRGYIGDPGHIYAAAFQLRFIASPGALPNALPLPTPFIDFARVRVLNPPWPSTASVAEALDTASEAETHAQMARDAAEVAKGLANAAQSTADQAVTDAANAKSTADQAAIDATAAKQTADQAAIDATSAQATADQAAIDAASAQATADQAVTDAANAQATADQAVTDAANAQSAAAAAQSTADQAVTDAANAQSTADQAVTDAASAEQSATSASASVQQLAGQVNTIGAHLNAEDARFVSTNYNSSTHMPEAYVEIKLPDQSWAVIWREMTRWNWLFDTWVPDNLYSKSQVDAALDQKADRAFGYYDSHSGTYAPDGYTWLSSPKVALAAGLGYQRTVTAEGAIWVLESNGLVTETGGVASNGFFRISDDEGNVHFEIVKGNRRTIGADASSCQVVAGFSPTKLQIGYSVISDAHPTLRICNNLNTQQWKDETDPDCLANVTWDGQSGAWVAYVQGKPAQSALFVKATYETGAESYIRNVAPVSMDFMYLGGVKYSVGTATISGHTVLTLTPAN